MADIANMVITLVPEVRPAKYWHERDGSTQCVNVLVHTTKTGRYGGYMLELEGGEMVEETDIGSNGCHLKFVDNLHGKYCFGLDDGE